MRLDGVDSIFRGMQAFGGVHIPHVLVRVLDSQRCCLLQRPREAEDVLLHSDADWLIEHREETSGGPRLGWHPLVDTLGLH